MMIIINFRLVLVKSKFQKLKRDISLKYHFLNFFSSFHVNNTENLLLAPYKEAMTYVTTFQLDLSFLTKDLKPLFGVNSSPLDELKMIVLLCCPSAFSAVASCEDWEQNCDTWANSNFKGL